MDYQGRGAELLRRTEADMRSVLSDAAAAGDYVAVETITAWARWLANAVGGVAPNVVQERPGRIPSGRARKPSKAQPVGSQQGVRHPYFLRRGETVLRIGWSKRNREEYEQKTPFGVVGRVAKKIVEKGAGGRIFSTSDLTPLLDEDGNEIPSYQIYATITLLKQAGLVDQHGRRGYSVLRPPSFETECAQVLRTLPGD